MSTRKNITPRPEDAEERLSATRFFSERFFSTIKFFAGRRLLYAKNSFSAILSARKFV